MGCRVTFVYRKRLAHSARPCSPQPSISIFVSILSPPGPGGAGLGLLCPGVPVNASDRKPVKFSQRPWVVLCWDPECDFHVRLSVKAPRHLLIKSQAKGYPIIFVTGTT